MATTIFAKVALYTLVLSLQAGMRLYEYKKVTHEIVYWDDNGRFTVTDEHGEIMLCTKSDKAALAYFPMFVARHLTSKVELKGNLKVGANSDESSIIQHNGHLVMIEIFTSNKTNAKAFYTEVVKDVGLNQQRIADTHFIRYLSFMSDNAPSL